MSFKKTRYAGVFYNPKTGRYLARKTILGKQHKETFDNEGHARVWRATFDGKAISAVPGKTSTLRHVWKTMQERHFPLVAVSTRDIWRRRYELLKPLEEFMMEELTVAKITGWVEENVAYFKSEEYTDSCRGLAKRCNLDNELNLLTLIFNWYKASEEFEAEAISLTNPVKTKHKKMGFIRVKPVKDKAITLEAALQFFQFMKPLYRDLAQFQFFTASRIGEVAGLQWSRVDFENRRVTIMETCYWNSDKVFESLNEYPKNKEPRPVYMNDELMMILKRQLAFRRDGCGFVFHVEGSPLNYGTIQANYRDAQRKARIPFRGTHILRHGMAKLARQVGGGLDAVIAMTGHKDFKLADHYSTLDGEFQKDLSIKILEKIRAVRMGESNNDNVLDLKAFSKPG